MTDRPTYEPTPEERAATPMASDQTGNAPAALTVAGSTAVSEPIVLRNELWAPPTRTPTTAAGPPRSPHLAEFGATEAGRHDDARWSGLLEVIPTKADYVLDLLRANSLWPLLSGLACCAIEMMASPRRRTTSTAGARSRSGPRRARRTS